MGIDTIMTLSVNMHIQNRTWLFSVIWHYFVFHVSCCRYWTSGEDNLHQVSDRAVTWMPWGWRSENLRKSHLCNENVNSAVGWTTTWLSTIDGVFVIRWNLCHLICRPNWLRFLSHLVKLITDRMRLNISYKYVYRPTTHKLIVRKNCATAANSNGYTTKQFF